MPKTNRQYMLRYAAEGINDLERCLARLGILRNIYAGAPPPMEQDEDTKPEMIQPIDGKDHKEYREAVEGIGLLVAQAHDLLTTFHDQVM